MAKITTVMNGNEQRVFGWGVKSNIQIVNFAKKWYGYRQYFEKCV